MASAGIGDSVEGFHAVAAAANAGRVEHLLIEKQRLRRDEYAALLDLVDGYAVVDDVRSEAATTTPQGVVARCRPIRTVSVEEAAALIDPAAVLVLDHVTDPRNVGAIARSALGAGVAALLVSERRSAPINATAFKSASGALEHVAVAQIGAVADAMRTLRKLGVWLIGLDGDAEQSLFGLDLFTEPAAIVVGTEGAGLSRLVADNLDVAVRIPMHAELESLNVSVAASLAMFEMARVRGSLPD